MNAENKISTFIADDNELMRDMLTAHLNSMDCEVVVKAEDGQGILTAIADQVPDMLFLDIEMPNMNGLELLEKLQEKGVSTFIVMVSGHSNFANVKAAIEKGANAFVVKPYTLDKIEQVITEFRKSKNS
jgi:YesN/AraC family two-component response regulator